MSQQNRNKLSMKGLSKRRLYRGIVYILIALAAWIAQQQGWIDLDKSSQQSPNDSSQTTSTHSSNSNVTIKEPEVLTSKNSSQNNDNALIAQHYKNRKSDEIVTAVGKVGKVLADDNKGSRHQKFLLDIGQDKWLLVAHNIDLAQRVPLKQGDAIIVHGEYEWNEKGGVLHWTHHDPRGYHEDGYIEHNGKRYK